MLFVLEGDAKEPKILDAVWNMMYAQLGGHKPPKTVYTYCTHIYELFKELSVDPDLDLLGLLKEDDPDGILSDADGDTFSSIYLFFDYDGHVNMPRKDDGGHWDGDDIISEMLNLFELETDNGKLFISYPMVEAIQHLDKTPTDVSQIITAKCKGPHCPIRDTCAERPTCPPVKDYKSHVAKETPALSRLSQIQPEKWPEIMAHHLATAALLHHGTTAFDRPVSQKEIFDCQKAYISLPCPQVAVLSGFPLFVVDYLGIGNTKRQLMLQEADGN